MNIIFIGNCQTISLCFYFQQLLTSENYNISWLLYGEEFKHHLNSWSNKCKNIILDYKVSKEKIKESDIIIYQEIILDKSLFSNFEFLNENKKESCKLIKIPSIYLNYSKYTDSLNELKNRETSKNVDLKVSTIIDKFKDKDIMLTVDHPTTFLFMEIIKELCILLNISFFSKEKETHFLSHRNYMKLP